MLDPGTGERTGRSRLGGPPWVQPNRAPTGPGAPDRYASRVAQPSDVEARLAALEARMDIVASDAAAARHLAAARDRDLADLGVKVDANRAAINALGEQTAAGFAEMRGKLDAAAAGQQRIVDLLTGLIPGPSDQQ